MHERGDEARVGVAWLIFFVWHGVQLLVVGHSRSWSLLGMAGGVRVGRVMGGVGSVTGGRAMSETVCFSRFLNAS